MHPMTIAFLLLVSFVWLAGWIATMASTEGEGGFFKRHIVRGVVLLFIWPYILFVMSSEMG